MTHLYVNKAALLIPVPIFMSSNGVRDTKIISPDCNNKQICKIQETDPEAEVPQKAERGEVSCTLKPSSCSQGKQRPEVVCSHVASDLSLPPPTKVHFSNLPPNNQILSHG